MLQNNSYRWNKLSLPFDEIPNLSILLAGFNGSRWRQRVELDWYLKQVSLLSEIKFFWSNSNTTYLMAVVLSFLVLLYRSPYL